MVAVLHVRFDLFLVKEENSRSLIVTAVVQVSFNNFSDGSRERVLVEFWDDLVK